MLPSVSNSNETARRQEAAEWHARLRTRAISNAELEGFYGWRTDLENARAFAEVETLWRVAGELENDAEIQAAVRFAQAPREGQWRGRWKLMLPAAVAALALIFALMGLRPQPSIYQTEVGERLVVKLDDGSRLTLDTATRVAVRYGPRGREVELEAGQALFEVAHDPARPFTVSADGTKVVALGTVFSVRRLDAGTHVTLIRGRISVATSVSPPLRLGRPGETLDAAQTGARLGSSDPAQAISWTSGKIDFRGATLAEAIAEVNRYTRRRILLDAQAQAGTKVSGVFATDDPEAFAAAVTILLPLSQTTTSDGAIHLQERR